MSAHARIHMRTLNKQNGLEKQWMCYPATFEYISCNGTGILDRSENTNKYGSQTFIKSIVTIKAKGVGLHRKQDS